MSFKLQNELLRPGQVPSEWSVYRPTNIRRQGARDRATLYDKLKLLGIEVPGSKTE